MIILHATGHSSLIATYTLTLGSWNRPQKSDPGASLCCNEAPRHAIQTQRTGFRMEARFHHLEGDPNALALAIEGGAAGVAAVDGCVYLHA